MIQDGDLILTPEDAALLVRALDALKGASAIAWNWNSDSLTPWRDITYRLKACAALVPPPLNGDKVWSGLTTNLIRTGSAVHNQSKTIVRAKSRAEAVRLLNLAGGRSTPHEFANYWSVTGNREELCVAKERGVYVKGPEGWIKK